MGLGNSFHRFYNDANPPGQGLRFGSGRMIEPRPTPDIVLVEAVSAAASARNWEAHLLRGVLAVNSFVLKEHIRIRGEHHGVG